MEACDTHLASSMRRVYNHTRGHGLVITGSTVVFGKEDLCEAFLRKVSNKFYGGRIDMKWWGTNFKELPTDMPNVDNEKYAQAFILRLIRAF
ncbi:hypothetical protein J1N35_000928 [Gossypium stocksii]|uniref:Uncharacterized protein n=1 Tax=Gossypium stocksii TaxID=47602 RepID=A0A9D3WI42_9ROSI|nr:hypothetical protein J1N35_000928 [Gossypium stocksii]